MMNATTKYPKPMIALHWLTLILLIFTFVKGKSLENVEFIAENITVFRSHAIPGMILLILTLIRLFVKKRNKSKMPVEIKYYNAGHKLIVNTVNKLLYLLLIVTPLIGFIMIYKTGALAYDFGGDFPTGTHFNETLEVLHKVFVFLLLGIIVLHVVGVIMFKIKTGENLVRRICKFMK